MVQRWILLAALVGCAAKPQPPTIPPVPCMPVVAVAPVPPSPPSPAQPSIAKTCDELLHVLWQRVQGSPLAAFEVATFERTTVQMITLRAWHARCVADAWSPAALACFGTHAFAPSATAEDCLATLSEIQRERLGKTLDLIARVLPLSAPASQVPPTPRVTTTPPALK